MVTVAEALAAAARHHQEGELADAERIYRQILEIEPDHAHTLHLLGIVALQTGRVETAAELIGKAIAADRSRPVFYAALAEVYCQSNRFDEAAACCLDALKLDPGLAVAHSQLGRCYEMQGNLTDAEASFRKVLQTGRATADAHYNLGSVLQGQGKMAEAAECYRAALLVNPRHFESHNNLGLILKRQNQWDQAAAHFAAALRERPNLAAAHINLATIHQQLGRIDQALASYRDAVQAEPLNATAHSALGTILMRARRMDQAIACCRRAIELDPSIASAHNTLGAALQAQGRQDDAVRSYRTAVRLNPEDFEKQSNFLYSLNFSPTWQVAEVFAEHRSWGECYADPLTAASMPHGNVPTGDRRLRIGYVSAHFCNHSVNFFTEPILAAHDHQPFEIYCYSNVERADETTKRLRGYADHWQDILLQPDELVAQLVRRDQIDILVDLTGHIGGNRLRLLALKPAPIQVSYIGYQNTTGMRAMDYRLTDDYSDPPGQTDVYYTEQLVRLPRSFFCYLPSANAPPVVSPPAVKNAYVSFGSFNNFAKVTPQVLKVWSEILKNVPGARLLIVVDAADSVRQYVLHAFDSHGIGRERLTLIDRRPRREYLDVIQCVDIALDPFPFNGHTTTCDALWQGVPVVTLSGMTFSSRFGASALATLGLKDMIASTPEHYVKIAARLAGDITALAQIRDGLRARMAASPLLDFQGFTRNLEAAYRQMWTDWCKSR